MKIERIEPVNTKKKKLFLEDGRVFALYNGELYRYKLLEGGEFSEETYQEILDTVLKKRARERLLYLLKSRDYTETQLRRKLQQGFYPEEAIAYAIAFGKERRYIDDARYAQLYAQQKAGSISRRQLFIKLSEKGISRELIEQALSGLEEKEEDTLERLLRRKNVDFSAITWQERQKICTYFMRKGFAYENILKKISEIGGMEHLT